MAARAPGQRRVDDRLGKEGRVLSKSPLDDRLDLRIVVAAARAIGGFEDPDAVDLADVGGECGAVLVDSPLRPLR
jgi:hypothetical protein